MSPQGRGEDGARGDEARPGTVTQTPPRSTAERLIIVTAGANPTLDYYITPRLAVPVERRPSRIVQLSHPADALLASPAAEGAHVVLCRYVSAHWIEALARHRTRLAGVSLLADDDIAAVIGDPSAPLLYRRRLRARFLDQWPRLAPLLDQVLVSTPALAARFPSHTCRHVHPVGSPEDDPLGKPPGARVRIAFHATGIHAAEHAWLSPVLRRVKRRNPEAELHVIAGWGLRLRWLGAAAVLTSPVPWPEYRRQSHEAGADLLLAPLLDTPVNAVRAPTKRIDAMRMGAALLTNSADVYDPDQAETGAGMMAPLDPGAWERRICDLVSDRMRLARLASLNADHVQRWRDRLGPLPV